MAVGWTTPGGVGAGRKDLPLKIERSARAVGAAGPRFLSESFLHRSFFKRHHVRRAGQVLSPGKLPGGGGDWVWEGGKMATCRLHAMPERTEHLGCTASHACALQYQQCRGPAVSGAVWLMRHFWRMLPANIHPAPPPLQPAQAACKHLGVGLTVLKRISRTFGISAWPYRKAKQPEVRRSDPCVEGGCQVRR